VRCLLKVFPTSWAVRRFLDPGGRPGPGLPDLVTNLPAATKRWRGQPAYIDAGHLVHARVEDAIRTGRDCGIGKYPSTSLAMNKAWQAIVWVTDQAHQ
jgi:hypothetical protein